jgi:hypothetical protein
VHLMKRLTYVLCVSVAQTARNIINTYWSEKYLEEKLYESKINARFSLFWDVTQVLLIVTEDSGHPSYRSHPQGSSSPSLNTGPIVVSKLQ